MAAIGEYICLLRDKKKLTQKELAEMLQVNPNYISMLENSKRSPSPKLLKNLASIFEISFESLLNPGDLPLESSVAEDSPVKSNIKEPSSVAVDNNKVCISEVTATKSTEIGLSQVAQYLVTKLRLLFSDNLTSSEQLFKIKNDSEIILLKVISDQNSFKVCISMSDKKYIKFLSSWIGNPTLSYVTCHSHFDRNNSITYAWYRQSMPLAEIVRDIFRNGGLQYLVEADNTNLAKLIEAKLESEYEVLPW